MILLPDDLRSALRANAAASLLAQTRGTEFDPVPVLKLFSPLGPGTWLVTEMFEDGHTLFGLADLGFGYPELGTFSLSEIMRVRLPFGLSIERDLTFETRISLSVWAETSRRAGSIIWAEALLDRARPEE